MPISFYKKQRIMLLARLKIGIGSEDQEEIDFYKYYQKRKYTEQNGKNNCVDFE